MIAAMRHLGGGALVWLGSRSRRELVLLGLVCLLALGYLFANGIVAKAWQDLSRERVRLRASQVTYRKLEHLVDRRDEIMAQASRLVDQYLQSQELEASTLLLQRIDGARPSRVELISVYPLGGEDQAKRFRAKLRGSAGDLARLFFALGEGAPPIILRELSLSAATRESDALTVTALLAVEQKGLPETWMQAFAGSAGPDSLARAGGGSQSPGSRARRRARIVPPLLTTFPYPAIDRPGVFAAVRPTQRRRLEIAAPTIQTMMQSLALMGVIWGDEPVAIVEDQSARQTHYRNVGQYIGELEIVEITRSAVVFRYKDEEGRLE